jgi:hypothetical protein
MRHVNKDPIEILSEKWHDCHEETVRLYGQIQALQTQLADLERKHQIALDNAYADGYSVGYMDARRKHPDATQDGTRRRRKVQ